MLSKLHIEEGDVLVLSTPTRLTEYDVEQLRYRIGKAFGKNIFVVIAGEGASIKKLPRHHTVSPPRTMVNR